MRIRKELLVVKEISNRNKRGMTMKMVIDRIIKEDAVAVAKTIAKTTGPIPARTPDMITDKTIVRTIVRTKEWRTRDERTKEATSKTRTRHSAVMAGEEATRLRREMVKVEEGVVMETNKEALEMENQGEGVTMVTAGGAEGMEKEEGEVKMMRVDVVVEMEVARIVNNRGVVGDQTVVERKAEVAIEMTTKGNH